MKESSSMCVLDLNTLILTIYFEMEPFHIKLTLKAIRIIKKAQCLHIIFINQVKHDHRGKLQCYSLFVLRPQFWPF